MADKKSSKADKPKSDKPDDSGVLASLPATRPQRLSRRDRTGTSATAKQTAAATTKASPTASKAESAAAAAKPAKAKTGAKAPARKKTAAEVMAEPATTSTAAAAGKPVASQKKQTPRKA